MTARTRGTFLVLEAFVAVGAAYGGVRLLIDAQAFGMREAWLGTVRRSPTTRFPVRRCWSGSGAAWRSRGRSPCGTTAGPPRPRPLMGAVLAVFLAVETAVIGYRAAVQLVLIVAMGVPAALLIVLGARGRRTG